MKAQFGLALAIAMFSASASAGEVSPNAALSWQFTASADGPAAMTAVQTAVGIATYNAKTQGFSNCQLTNYVYSQNPRGLSWQAKVWLSCTK